MHHISSGQSHQHNVPYGEVIAFLEHHAVPVSMNKRKHTAAFGSYHNFPSLIEKGLGTGEKNIIGKLYRTHHMETVE